MYDFLAQFDGTGRTPRKEQETALKWCANDYHLYPIDAIAAPVGTGKSGIGRAIQIETDAFYIAPSNVLIDQLIETYPDVNYLKGKHHYTCTYAGVSCGDWQDVQEQPACDKCPYKRNRYLAKIFGLPTFFNPMSLYHLHSEKRKCIIVDEAHQLSSLLIQTCSKRFVHSEYNFSAACERADFLYNWLGEKLVKLTKLQSLYQNLVARKPEQKKKLQAIADEIETIGLLRQCLNEEPENYAIWIEHGRYRGKPESFLHVRPVRVPASVVRRLLNCDKLILMSGTLFHTDIEDLAAGRSFRYLDLPSPIPKENRPVFYRPMPFPVNKDTDLRMMAAEIEKILALFPNRNTIIHSTYERCQKMVPYFKRPVLTNTPETKAYTLEKFKREGGVWLAAGCAEGLDLKDDYCRLNIIPHLLRPNLGDPVVKKWRALPNGDRRYAIETIKGTVQQYGRSTRSPSDTSITVVMDPGLPQIVNRYADAIPRYFTEAIEWRLPSGPNTQ